MDKVSSGVITGMLKTRYKVISTILGELYNPTKGLDIYLDFDTFVKSLSGYQKYLNYLPFSGNDVEIDLISSFLTTLNHWKNFAKKWDNVRIIGIMNSLNSEKISMSGSSRRTQSEKQPEDLIMAESSVFIIMKNVSCG